MLFRLTFLRSKTFALLILCVGLAVAGALLADHLLRQEDLRQRIVWSKLRKTLKEPGVTMPPFSDMDMNQPIPSVGAKAVSIGLPLFAHFSIMGPILMGAKDLPVGFLAPDFFLPDISMQRAVHLADFRGKKPVLLLFGSFG
jgi:hypothetical protein